MGRWRRQVLAGIESKEPEGGGESPAASPAPSAELQRRRSTAAGAATGTGEAPPAKLSRFVTQAPETPSPKTRRQTKAAGQAKHLEMVAHFNLRRLSMGNGDASAAAAEAARLALQDAVPWWRRALRPINPEARWRRIWEVVVMVIVVWQAIFIPYSVSFQPPSTSTSTAFDLAIDGIFLLDLAMTFNVALPVQHKYGQSLITSRVEIAKRYLKCWFWIDLVASVPFDQIILLFYADEASSNVQVLGLLKGLRLPRLLRLLKLMRILRFAKLARLNPELVHWFRYSRHANLLRLVRLLGTILVITHFMACIWYSVSERERWLDEWAEREELELGAEGYYHSLLMINGEQIEPITVNEQIFATFAITIGSVIVASVFGNVALAVSNFNHNSQAYQAKMESLYESMAHLCLPSELKQRVHLYYENMWREYHSLDGTISMFVPELNKALGSEVILHLRTDLILMVPFFVSLRPDLVAALVTALEVEVFLPADYVFHADVFGTEMFIVSRGVCELTVPAGDEDSHRERVVAERPQGAFFGELALVATVQRACNVRAKLFSELLVLTREAFDAALVVYAAERDAIVSMLWEEHRRAVPITALGAAERRMSEFDANRQGERGGKLDKPRHIAVDTVAPSGPSSSAAPSPACGPGSGSVLSTGTGSGSGSLVKERHPSMMPGRAATSGSRRTSLVRQASSISNVTADSGGATGLDDIASMFGQIMARLDKLEASVSSSSSSPGSLSPSPANSTSSSDSQQQPPPSLPPRLNPLVPDAMLRKSGVALPSSRPGSAGSPVLRAGSRPGSAGSPALRAGSAGSPALRAGSPGSPAPQGSPAQPRGSQGSPVHARTAGPPLRR